MDNIEAEYNNYWETRMFLENEEVDSWGFDLDEGFSSYYNSSSPDRTGSPDGAASPNRAESLDGARTSSSPAVDKNIVMERNRRKRYNDRLYALRSEVPYITKMDKESIVKDAIGYIQVLQEQERKMVAEITELELRSQDTSPISEITQDHDYSVHSSWKKLMRSTSSSALSTTSFPQLVPIKLCIEVLELKVCEVGDNSHIISITCNKKKDTMMNVCKLFDSLGLKIMNANITIVDGSLLHTLFVEDTGMSTAQLKEKIQVSIVQHDFHSQ